MTRFILSGRTLIPLCAAAVGLTAGVTGNAMSELRQDPPTYAGDTVALKKPEAGTSAVPRSNLPKTSRCGATLDQLRLCLALPEGRNSTELQVQIENSGAVPVRVQLGVELPTGPVYALRYRLYLEKAQQHRILYGQNYAAVAGDSKPIYAHIGPGEVYRLNLPLDGFRVTASIERDLLHAWKPGTQIEAELPALQLRSSEPHVTAENGDERMALLAPQDGGRPLSLVSGRLKR